MLCWKRRICLCVFPFLLPLLSASFLPAVSAGQKRPAGGDASKLPKTAAPVFKPDDVMATVEGEKITRRELTYFWVQTDQRTHALLGSLLADRWKVARGTAPSYTIPEAQIYARLYSDKNALSANILSALITYKLVAIETTRRGILVTKTQLQASAHQRWEQVRKERGLQLSDEKLAEMFKVPLDIFMKDMLFNLQTEKLMAAEFARQNGHPLRPDDWAVVRHLFAAARLGDEGRDREGQFAEARQRLDEWLKEIKQGKSFEDAARDHNEDSTRSTGGLRGPILRGRGTKALEDAVYALKPGERSAPLRGRGGWYVFQMERRGTEIPEEERTQVWKQTISIQKPQFLADLRSKARITSTIPLPVNPPAPSTTDTLLDASPSSLLQPPAPPRR